MLLPYAQSTLGYWVADLFKVQRASVYPGGFGVYKEFHYERGQMCGTGAPPHSNKKVRALLEHSSERTSRLKREEADARLQRLEKFLPVGLVSLLVLCAVVVYLVVMLSGNYGAEDKERAEKVLAPIITGLLGYFSGMAKRNNLGYFSERAKRKNKAEADEEE